MEETIGERVRRLRKAKDWTQVALAYNAGRAPSVVSQVETGKREPELSTIKHLAEALGVDWRYLLLGDQLPKSPAPSVSGPLSGAEDESLGEVTLVPWDVSFHRMLGAGDAAVQVARDWRVESGERLKEGRPLAKYRTLEMRSFHNELSRLYVDNLKGLLKGAREGIVGTIEEGVSRPFDPDPTLWPREIKEPLHEAGARIATLPQLIEEIEREASERDSGAAGLPPHEALGIEDQREKLSEVLAEVGV